MGQTFSDVGHTFLPPVGVIAAVSSLLAGLLATVLVQQTHVKAAVTNKSVKDLGTGTGGRVTSKFDK